MANQKNKLGSFITRKDFISYSVAGSLFLCLPAFLTKPFCSLTKQYFSIKPILGVHYKPSFLAFCQKAKFSSAQQAISAVKNHKIPFEVCYET